MFKVYPRCAIGAAIDLYSCLIPFVNDQVTPFRVDEMKRPEQQIIDDAGERQMKSIFEPLGWAVRPLTKERQRQCDVESAVAL